MDDEILYVIEDRRICKNINPAKIQRNSPANPKENKSEKEAWWWHTISVEFRTKTQRRQRLNRRKEHMEELFEDEQELQNIIGTTGPAIT